MQREVIEGTLRSEFGMQRLPRVGRYPVNRLQLFPRESVESEGELWWRRGAFHFGIRSERRLTHGTKLVFGSTEVIFEERRQQWPVDPEREAALAMADRAAWNVFTDELLSRGDPLGAFLSGNGERDVSFLLDVAPALARGILKPTTGTGGEWRTLTFALELAGRGEDVDEWADEGLFEFYTPESLFEAVLSHPAAWFVEEVQLELPANEELDDGLVEFTEMVIDELAAARAPNLRRFVTPRRLPPSAISPERNNLKIVRR